MRKIRLTGGEPLLRRNLERAGRRCWPSCARADGAPLDLTLTTNGSLLARKAAALKAAGLGRVTVSLDALDDAIFRRMNDADFPVADVLRGIDAAERAGLGPIKVNMVVKRGTNDAARSCRWRATSAAATSRCASSSTWTSARPTAGAWTRCCRRPRSSSASPPSSPLEPLPRRGAGRDRGSAGATPSRRAGEIGTISSVTQAFCRDCNRARLSTEGKLFLCLFASRGHDLRALLRGGASDAEIAAAIGLVWQERDDRYSELRGAAPGTAGGGERRVEMHYIGG